MPKIDDETRIRHMLDAASRATELMQGLERADLDVRDVTALAIVRILEILGEAANGVSIDLQSRYPLIPWRQMIGTRNRLIHAYFSVDLDIVWHIATLELPGVIEQLEDLLRSEGWY